ncbi:MAG: DUF1343 domain-containing protein [Pirellulaceae bacterium]|nr:DUF1343 domain-containing protein [Pirellulaceae bacterium]
MNRDLKASCFMLTFVCSLTVIVGAGISTAHELQIASPEDCGMNSDRLVSIEKLINEAIDDKKLPGCVVCVGRLGKIAYLKSFGNKRLEPSIEPMTIDTVFDMASITKPVATATCVMRLVEIGKLGLTDKVSNYFPDFAKHGKENITLQDLLLHRSGLIPDNAMSDYADGPDRAWDKICDLKLTTPVGTAFKYSDVNFIVLGKVVEQVSGQKLNEFVDDAIFRPLGMSESGFLPKSNLRERAAPTEKRNKEWMQGEVHDPRAFALGGVAGHAGLFSTAQDLSIYAQMMLGQGTFRREGDANVRILSPATVATMTKAYEVPGGLRGLGWDKRSSYSINRGDLFSASAFGHGGFTGTVLWIDLELDCFFIFLSNRVHPNGSGSVNQLAGRIANIVASSIEKIRPSYPPATAKVLLGIDVLERDHFNALAGQRIGLITNQTGRNQHGMSTIEVLKKAPHVQLMTLFSPEHGFEGKLDIAKIADKTDSATGLKIRSLYGETRRPTKEMLSDIDTLVFDIQDIGVRFYTYISTMGEAMIAAAENHRRFVVLDRPNPLNGVDVTGPMLDAGSESFVAFHQLPVRHGMTIGELAKMFRDELKLELDLEVIACEGWQRPSYWDLTGLTWINPSPNMRSLTQAILYPGIGLLEMTNLSVGRGTDTPFEIVGAPWIDGRSLAIDLNQQSLAGVVFIPIEFTPESSKYLNEICRGINIQITDRKIFEPIQVGLAIAETLHRLHPQAWQTQHLNRLLGHQATLRSVLTPTSIADRKAAMNEGVDEFLRRRQAFLIYGTP